MRILGIETSCDETAIAILEIMGKKRPRFRNVQISNFTLLERFRQGRITFRILSNIIASQAKLHAAYGGVYPSLAKREHIVNLPIVLQQALNKARISSNNVKRQASNKVDMVAVTYGPGLDPCLWTGIEFAKNLANKWNVPLIPIDHMEGHLLVSLLLHGNEKSTPKKTFPVVALLVSGGHTQLVLIKGIGKYKVIGETRDDAAGECFDKTARILGLPYPGGPAIAAEAAKIRSPKSEIRIKLPRPMMHTKDYDFSFSGLKTAALYDFQSRTAKVQKSKEYIRAMAKEIQQAIIDVLVAKTMKAVWKYQPKSIIIGGGVAANNELRAQLKAKIRESSPDVLLLCAPKELCTDNGVMPALAGYFNLSKKKHGEAVNRIAAKPNLRLE